MTEFDRYRVLFADHLGLARGKYVPSRVADRGTAFSVGIWTLGYDRAINEVDVGLDLTGFPDVDATFDIADARPGWEERTGVVVADITTGGELFPTAARTVLRRAVADWAEHGYNAKVGIELEAYVMEPDGDGGWRPFHTPSAFVYGTGPFTDPTGLIDEIMTTAAACDIPVESMNSEFDFPQFELTLEYGDALESIDSVFLFKEMAREIALRHGKLLTFMGKPIGDKSGSGLHVNFSLARADGSNAMADPETADGISALAHQCVAGILDHHEALAALCAPTVNAYKRLAPGELCGYWANWGHDHRLAAVRIPPHRGGATRVEQRTADGAANPYVAAAAVLQAARLGVVGDLTPPEPETGDGVESVNTERCCGPNLSAALDALQADQDFVDAVGPELIANFIAIKRVEWDQYVTAVPDWEQHGATVTDWELDTYLPFH